MAQYRSTARWLEATVLFYEVHENCRMSITLEISSGATLTWGHLSHKYIPMMMDFHWGESGTPGSEHTIDGTHHYMEVSESDNETYNDLVNLANVKVPEAEAELDITLNNLILPEENMKAYYYYEGSLTTPNCQPVMRTLFKEPIQLSQAQLDAFHEVMFDADKKLVSNYRPVQPLHERVVYSDGIPSSGAILVVSFTFILMCLSAALGCCQL